MPSVWESSHTCFLVWELLFRRLGEVEREGGCAPAAPAGGAGAPEAGQGPRQPPRPSPGPPLRQRPVGWGGERMASLWIGDRDRLFGRNFPIRRAWSPAFSPFAPPLSLPPPPALFIPRLGGGRCRWWLGMSIAGKGPRAVLHRVRGAGIEARPDHLPRAPVPFIPLWWLSERGRPPASPADGGGGDGVLRVRVRLLPG